MHLQCINYASYLYAKTTSYIILKVKVSCDSYDTFYNHNVFTKTDNRKIYSIIRKTNE